MTVATLTSSLLSLALHFHGLHFLVAELVQSRALGRRLTATATGSTGNKAAGTDAALHIVLVAGKGAGLVQTADGAGTADAGFGLDETQVAAHGTQLAEFVVILLVGGNTAAQGLAVQGKATGMANAEDIFFHLNSADNVLAVHGNVRAAAGFHQAASRLYFVVRAHDSFVC